MGLKVAIAVACVILTGISLPANAQKRYTPAQLRTMVERGSYPAQAAPSNQVESLDFSSCKNLVEGMLNDVKANYPVQSIAESSIVWSKKVWTNDGAIVFTCSKPDKTFTSTTSPYL